MLTYRLGPHWTDNFITYDDEWEKYIAWDETQTYDIGSYETYNEAKIALEEYAKTL